MKPYILAHISTLAALTALGLATVPAVHAQQSLFVANLGDNTIEEFNDAGVGTQFKASSNMGAPSGLAFDSAGSLFVTSANNIEEFNSAGVGTQFNVSGDLNTLLP